MRCTLLSLVLLFFFYIDPATSELYTLSLHDALPIYRPRWDGVLRFSALFAHHRGEEWNGRVAGPRQGGCVVHRLGRRLGDRKSTRLNSSHVSISYAVFCLKKKTTSYCRQICRTTLTT